MQEQRSKPNVQHPAVQRVSTAELDGKVQCLLPANGAQLPGQPCHRQQVPAARRRHRTPNGGNLGGAPGSCDRADRYRGMSSSLSLGSAAAAWYARLHRRRRRRDGRAGVAGGAVGCRCDGSSSCLLVSLQQRTDAQRLLESITASIKQIQQLQAAQKVHCTRTC